MRIGRYGVGVCQIADCDKDSVIHIFTRRYRSALAPKGFEFKFSLCPDHRYQWDDDTMGKIHRTEIYTVLVSRETGET